MDKQIIIDGCDVSGCKSFYSKTKDCIQEDTVDIPCGDYPNCYYKQLKRKEQECERLERIVAHSCHDILYEDSLRGQLDQLKAENEELKKIIERLDVPKHEVIDMDIALENEKLKQTLTEIKEIVGIGLVDGLQPKEYSGFLKILQAQILQKISECG